MFWQVWLMLQLTSGSTIYSSNASGVQVGLPAGLNLYYNLPTVHPQGQSGYAHKAVACLMDASRFCVLQLIWPRIRGRDG